MTNPASRELVTPQRLRAFFAPKSIALVGASENSGWARFIVASCAATGFAGRLTAVHPRARTAFGLPVVPSLRDLPEPADLAFILVPVHAVGDVLDDMGAAGIPNAVVLASGYREVGEDGRGLEEALLARAIANGVTVLGPNCLGFVNAHTRSAPYALSLVPPLIAGPVGVALQSGALASVVLGFARAGRNLGDFDRAMLVHAEQAFELHRPLPVAGTVRTVSTVTGIYDKGSGALVVTENVAVDAATSEPLVTSRTSAFIRGEGGFGGERGTDPPWARPDREPDYQVIQQTRPEQALIYRLSGDRNPLHVDPKFAARGGFSQPILHGLCTYGVTGRALLYVLCDSDPARFRSMAGRFSRPVLPGEPLTVSVWRQDGTDTALFQTTKQDGTVVIDRGRLQVRQPVG